jgi:aminopeptidase-like protein
MPLDELTPERIAELQANEARYFRLNKIVLYMRTYQMKYDKYHTGNDQRNMVKYEGVVDRFLADKDVSDNSQQLKLI